MRFPVTQAKSSSARSLPALPHLSAARMVLWVTAASLWLAFAAILGMTLSQMAASHNGEYPNGLFGFWLFLSVIPGASAFSLTQWLVLIRPARG